MRGRLRLPLIRGIRALDIVILAACAAATAYSAAAVWSGGRAATVVVECEGREWVYPISDDAHVEIQGILGPTVIEIEDSTVRVEESACKNKLCVHQGRISAPGSWIACLPNGVLVRIEGEREDSDVDAVSF
jgi:hypothetical protein